MRTNMQFFAWHTVHKVASDGAEKNKEAIERKIMEA